MTGPDRDPPFVAPTRPPMSAGVAPGWFVANAVIAAELFLILPSPWAIAAALIVHGVGLVPAAREPRFLDLRIVEASRCPRPRNQAPWRCNSCRP